ncbi:transcriptional regulator [Photobacterium rosenbergii]|uniref:Transcriptional regulator n=1 Tax=Photobacterium rosenbergii TaxID=294936 RepID=A0A2T3NKX3_9GAMM|nr:winged helix-turn-helix domain-containing protein [Photobacterium rosenbergii]PSW16168.1 transcriptional regulator [Photobacterium rosenbergii]
MTAKTRYLIHHEPQIVFMPDQNQIVIEQQEIHLEPLQSKLLSYFIVQNGVVVNARQIADSVWQRSQVSDNLVRQVVSLLRSQLKDKSRPYQIVKTIPKQGYLFEMPVSEISAEENNTEELNTEKANIELSNTEEACDAKCSLDKPHTVDEVTLNPEQSSTHKYKRLAVVLSGILALSVMGFGAGYIWKNTQPSPETIVTAKTNLNSPVFLHQVQLDTEQDFEMAQSVYNYLFYGLNSAKTISGYHFSELTAEAKDTLENNGFELKSWIKHNGQDYTFTVLLQNTKHPQLNHKIEKRFNEQSFFNDIGDIVLEIKSLISPNDPGYEISNHRITSISDYKDWKAISAGISLFYQGKGNIALDAVAEQLQMIKAQGRENYLVNSLLSYHSSLAFLQSGNEYDKELALSLAHQAFEMNPRCDIANLTLGLALLLNERNDQAFPYLFYAAESTPSPISFYLLSIVDTQSENPRGAAYHYQCYSDMKKEVNGQLFDLMKPLQKPNLFQTQAKEH